MTCSGLRHLSDDHLSSSDLSSRCLEVYIVIPHLHDLLLLITIVIMTIMLTIMTIMMMITSSAGVPLPR